MNKKFAYSDKHKLIAPEDIEINTLYSITFNPDKQYGGSLGYIYHDKDMFSLIKHKDIKFDLSREVSKKGRIHYHGIIYFTNKSNLLDIWINMIPKWLKQCTVYMDTIDDITVWKQYCNKQCLLWNLAGIPCGFDNLPGSGEGGRERSEESDV